MTRDARQLGLEAALCVPVVLAVWQAQQWDLRARLFPSAIGAPLLALLAIRVGLSGRRLTTDDDHGRRRTNEDGRRP